MYHLLNYRYGTVPSTVGEIDSRPSHLSGSPFPSLVSLSLEVGIAAPHLSVAVTYYDDVREEKAQTLGVVGCKLRTL
jgi:hypothetical protein